MESIFGVIRYSFLLFCGYSVFCGILGIISLWFIFKKENIPPYYSLIPFLNVYKYFKLCNIPFWTFFIPGINVICLYCSTYIITRKYRFKRGLAILSIFVPWFFLPYIAFSNKKSIDYEYNNVYIKNTDDIDKLESILENNVTDEFGDIVKQKAVKSNAYKDTLVDNIEKDLLSSNMRDEYVYDDISEFNEKPQEKENHVEADFVDINEDVDNTSLEYVDVLEENIKIDNSVEKKIITDIKDYKEKDVSNETIAFGGKNRIENVDSVKTKNDDLVCSRCGSSLVGATNFCPGCGAKI